MQTTLALVAVCGCAAIVNGSVVVETYGAAPRPGSVFGIPTLPAPYNPDLFTDISSTALAEGAIVSFSTPVNVRKVGEGWASWGGTYTGNVFWTSGAETITLDFSVPGGPNWIIAAQVYALSNPFGTFQITATATDLAGAQASATQTVDEITLARGWGFYSPDSFLRSINIRSDVDFGFGDIATALFIPAPGSLVLLALAAPVRRRRAAV